MGFLDGLPSGWTSAKDSAGDTYYYNANTQESTYTKPKQVKHAPSSITGKAACKHFVLALRRRKALSSHAHDCLRGTPHPDANIMRTSS